MAAEMVRRNKVLKFAQLLSERYEDLARTFSESDLKDSEFAKGVLAGRADSIQMLVKEFGITSEELGGERS